jgi:hypothetical protein
MNYQFPTFKIRSKIISVHLVHLVPNRYNVISDLIHFSVVFGIDLVHFITNRVLVTQLIHLYFSC